LATNSTSDLHLCGCACIKPYPNNNKRVTVIGSGVEQGLLYKLVAFLIWLLLQYFFTDLIFQIVFMIKNTDCILCCICI